MTDNRPAETMVHGCFESADAMLGKNNTKLAMAVAWPAAGGKVDVRLMVGTEKVESKKRGSPVRVFANFCPFCGVHLP